MYPGLSDPTTKKTLFFMCVFSFKSRNTNGEGKTDFSSSIFILFWPLRWGGGPQLIIPLHSRPYIFIKQIHLSSYLSQGFSNTTGLEDFFIFTYFIFCFLASFFLLVNRALPPSLIEIKLVTHTVSQSVSQSVSLSIYLSIY